MDERGRERKMYSVKNKDKRLRIYIEVQLSYMEASYSEDSIE